jgi:hypothetical protein
MVFRKIADEAILVPIRGNPMDIENFYALNPVASFVWDLFDGCHSLPNIVDAIIEHYDVTPELAYADLLELVGHLKAIGALEDT